MRLEKTTPDEMEWNEVLQRIRERVQKAQRRQRKCLSNGIIATYGIESQDDGTVREQLVLYPKRGYNPYIPLVVIVFGATNIADLGWRFENFWSKTVWLSVAGVITLAGIAAIVKIIERLNRK